MLDIVPDDGRGRRTVPKQSVSDVRRRITRLALVVHLSC